MTNIIKSATATVAPKTTGKTGHHIQEKYNTAGPLAVKMLIEGQPVSNLTTLPKPWSEWATQIADRRNGKTAGDVWDSILAKLPAQERKAASEAVIKARPNGEQWQEELNRVLESLPDQFIATKTRLALVEALKQSSPGLDVDALLPQLRLIDSADIITKQFPDPVWAIPDVIPAGLALLAGRPKIGKSWLTMQIAFAVATGGHALGATIQKGRVLYLALEDSERRLQKRMIAQGWPAEARGAVKFLLYKDFREQIEYLNSGGGHRLAKHIEQEGYRLLVIDTLSKAFKGDQNDNAEMTAALGPIHEKVNTLDIAGIIVHHHAKPKGTDPNPVDDVMGSSAIAGVADTIIGLYKEQGKAGAKLAITGRDVEERTLQLKWDSEFFCWQNEGDANEITITEQRQKVIDFLTTVERAQVGAIANATGMNKGNAHTRLQDLVIAGLVERSTHRTEVYYQLLSNQPKLPN